MAVIKKKTITTVEENYSSETVFGNDQVVGGDVSTTFGMAVGDGEELKGGQSFNGSTSNSTSFGDFIEFVTKHWQIFSALIVVLFLGLVFIVRMDIRLSNVSEDAKSISSKLEKLTIDVVTMQARLDFFDSKRKK